MTTQSNAIPESHLQSQVIAPADISFTRRMYWSVRRELWESRSLYIAPLAVAALILFGFLISTIHLRDRMRVASTLDPMQQLEFIGQPYTYAALLLMFTTFIVAVFYCLDALHGERRDRSILFWKSLPVSDLTTVLSKASIPLVVLPLLTFAITVVTQFIMLMLSTVVLLGSRQSIATLWTQLPIFQMWLMLLYHLVAVHSLWYAPFYGWMLLVSAWARRAPFLWAALPCSRLASSRRLRSTLRILLPCWGTAWMAGGKQSPRRAASPWIRCHNSLPVIS
jgi:ABC-2 type transport system permease protein